METVVLSRTSRILAGHLWIFSNELAVSPKGFQPGSVVELRDKKGTFLGIGYINPASLIAVRILTRENEPIDADFFKKRIATALAYRKLFIKDSDSFRAVYSESDGVPGLIIDKYGECISMQFLTLGIETLSPFILSAIEEIFSPKTIVLRNDSTIRTLEGLPLEKKVVKGDLAKPPVLNLGGSFFEVDPMAGQKTGFFLDQAENRSAFSVLVSGRGLDLFSYAGAWSMAAGRSPAVSSVTGVDSSDYAVRSAQRNAVLNNLEDKCSFIKADVFEFVKQEVSKGASYDFVILDPPAFVKSKSRIKEAVKAYREINAASMRLLAGDGLMASSSCSYHIDRNTFVEILRISARDAGRNFRIIETRGQAKDHPVLLTVPETDYLKCVLLQAF